MTGYLISDHHITFHIQEQISKAQREITIVSPYVKVWNSLDRLLQEAGHRKVRRVLYYRSSESRFDPQSVKHLFDFLIPVQLLHAKIYFFDDIAMLSSMNLYDFSQSSSREVAMWVTDANQIAELRSYVRAFDPPPPPPPVAPTVASVGKSMASGALNVMGKAIGAVATAVADRIKGAPGSCIRCQTNIPFDPEKPLCADCFKQWNRFKNPEFQEKFCHDCGKPAKTSMSKPVCYPCYKAGS